MATNNRPILFISYPRSASNLFIRVLGLDKQPNVLQHSEFAGYYFLDTYLHMYRAGIHTKPLVDCSEAARLKAKDMLQKALGEIDSRVQEAKNEEKILFNKEHIHMLIDPYFRSKTTHGETSVRGEKPWQLQIPGKPAEDRIQENVTIIPDEYLRKWQATFLIRHPALSIPSYYRAQADIRQNPDADELLVFTRSGVRLKETRLLYDWYECDNDAAHPILLDAHDITHQPEVLHQYCGMVGLDPTALQFHWDTAQNIEKRDTATRFLKTLRESTGVIKGKEPQVVSIEREAQQWRDEFGEEVAQGLLKIVEEAMPDYEYLRTKRLRV